MNQRGFTLIELAIVLLVIGTLAAVATPHYMRARRGAVAARIVCDFNTIATAAMAAYSENQVFPVSAEWGQVPAEFAPHFPRSFKFRYRGVIYRWRCWSLPSGLPERPDQDILLGVQVQTKDPRLVQSVVGVYQGRVARLTGTQITLVIL